MKLVERMMCRRFNPTSENIMKGHIRVSGPSRLPLNASRSKTRIQKSPVSTTLRILAVAASLALLAAVQGSAQTSVGGGLYANTTWGRAQSPIVVTREVVLFPGYTLTIEPGVRVLFDENTGLTIRGSLIAEGTASDSIEFTANSGVSSWRGITIANKQGGSGSLSYVKGSKAQEFLGVQCCGNGGPVAVRHSRFFENAVVSGSYAGWKMTFDSCVFEGNETVFTSADKEVTNSVFRNNGYGLRETERVNVRNCEFSGHTEAALYGGRGRVEGCVISNNRVGVRGFFEGFDVDRCIITDNDTGIILSNYDGYSGAISNNNIVNRFMNVVNTGPYNVNITFNWWGTVDTNEILAKIQDGFDDPLLGLVVQPYYVEKLGRNAAILELDSGAAADSTIGVAVSILEAGSGAVTDSAKGVADSNASTVERWGRIAVAASEHGVDDTAFTAARTIDLAPSSDVVEGMLGAVLTFSYNGAALTEEEIAGLGVYYYDGEKWQFVGGEVDTAAKTVSAPIAHFSTYGLLVDRNAAGSRRIAIRQEGKTGLGNIRSLRNGGVAVEFRLSSTQQVEIAVYTTDGRLVGYAVRGTLPAGVHYGYFSAPLSSATVVVAMRSGNGVFAKRMALYR